MTTTTKDVPKKWFRKTVLAPAVETAFQLRHPEYTQHQLREMSTKVLRIHSVTLEEAMASIYRMIHPDASDLKVALNAHEMAAQSRKELEALAAEPKAYRNWWFAGNARLQQQIRQRAQRQVAARQL